MALPEHDEEAAQRSAVPPRSRVLDQHEPDPRQGLPGPRRQGEPDRPAAIWNKWIDKKVVAKYGFSYNLTGQAILAAAGYKDTDGDGYVENKDGSDISLKIQCPNGWSDWMTSIQVIAESAKAAGIKITPGYPDYGTLVDDRGHARYDLVLANDRQYSNTPWTYYQYIFQLPILDNQTTVNYERFSSRRPGLLTQQLDRTPTTNTKAYRAVMSKLQTTFLQNLPAIPLWYNGMWAMFNTTYWTNWPSATGGKYTPHRVEQLLADDEHRHAHASEAGQGN